MNKEEFWSNIISIIALTFITSLSFAYTLNNIFNVGFFTFLTLFIIAFSSLIALLIIGIIFILNITEEEGKYEDCYY
jgi:hypothetical protein